MIKTLTLLIFLLLAVNCMGQDSLQMTVKDFHTFYVEIGFYGKTDNVDTFVVRNYELIDIKLIRKRQP